MSKKRYTVHATFSTRGPYVSTHSDYEGVLRAMEYFYERFVDTDNMKIEIVQTLDYGKANRDE